MHRFAFAHSHKIFLDEVITPVEVEWLNHIEVLLPRPK